MWDMLGDMGYWGYGIMGIWDNGDSMYGRLAVVFGVVGEIFFIFHNLIVEEMVSQNW